MDLLLAFTDGIRRHPIAFLVTSAIAIIFLIAITDHYFKSKYRR